ncbi:MAG: hypothetical protein AB1420_12725 [Bacillota bacterium]
MKRSIIARILITLLGMALVLLGSSQVILGFVGKSTSAVITDIRREGGERTDGRPGRYTYNISYTFSLPDGKEINGFTKKIGSSVYLKADGTSTARVRYFPFFPYINAMEQDTGLGAGQLVLILAGGFLIFFINKKK